MELRDYQKAAKQAIYKEWEDKDSTLLVLPTGCGKTIVFGSIARDRAEDGRVLILAHREELLTQASDKIHKISGLNCSVEKADQTCLDSDEAITVGSVQTLQTERRLSRFPRDYFKTLIVDEAHHAMAQSYRNVLNHFNYAKVLGVTATPDRGDMKNLGEVFESLAYEYSLRDAVKAGYLSKIRVQTMPLNIDFSSVKVSMGDFQINDIGHALEPYLEDIADEMAKACMDRHTVVFLPLVSIAQEFRDILNRKGFRAAEVNGQSKNREEILKDFEDGKYNVLCNAMLLTEGWDCPIVDCIVVLRPTKIRSLYCQMLGRGTRPCEGKDHLLVLDFLWMTGKHDLVRPADIICKKEEIAKKVTEKLESGEPMDLFAAEEQVEHDVMEERKNALARELEEAAKQRKKQQKKLIDPLEFSLTLDMDELLDYVPTFGWEAMPATEKQIKTIQNFGLDPEGMCKGQASKIISKLMERAQEDMSTPRQIKTLTKFGFQNVQAWTFQEASKILSALSAAGWKPWLAHLEPAFYQPKRLAEQGVSWI